MVDITSGEVKAKISELFAQNTSGDISGLDAQDVSNAIVDYAFQIDTALSEEMLRTSANLSLINEQALLLGTARGDISDLKISRSADEQRITDLVEGLRTANDAISSLESMTQTGVSAEILQDIANNRSGVSALNTRLNNLPTGGTTQAEKTAIATNTQGLIDVNDRIDNLVTGTTQEEKNALLADRNDINANTQGLIDVNDRIDNFSGGTTQAEKTAISNNTSGVSTNASAISALASRLDGIDTGGEMGLTAQQVRGFADEQIAIGKMADPARFVSGGDLYQPVVNIVNSIQPTAGATAEEAQAISENTSGVAANALAITKIGTRIDNLPTGGGSGDGLTEMQVNDLADARISINNALDPARFLNGGDFYQPVIDLIVANPQGGAVNVALLTSRVSANELRLGSLETGVQSNTSSINNQNNVIAGLELANTQRDLLIGTVQSSQQENSRTILSIQNALAPLTNRVSTLERRVDELGSATDITLGNFLDYEFVSPAIVVTGRSGDVTPRSTASQPILAQPTITRTITIPEIDATLFRHGVTLRMRVGYGAISDAPNRPLAAPGFENAEMIVTDSSGNVVVSIGRGGRDGYAPFLISTGNSRLTFRSQPLEIPLTRTPGTLTFTFNYGIRPSTNPTSSGFAFTTYLTFDELTINGQGSFVNPIKNVIGIYLRDNPQSASGYNDTAVRLRITENENNISNIQQTLTDLLNDDLSYDDTALRALIQTNADDIESNTADIGTNNSSITALSGRIDRLPVGATTAQIGLINANTQGLIDVNSRINNLPTGGGGGTTLSQSQLDNINAIPTLLTDVGTVGATPDLDTGLLGDVKALKRNVETNADAIGSKGENSKPGTGLLGDVEVLNTDAVTQDEAIKEADRKAQEALDREVVSNIDRQDFITEAGSLPANNPGVAYPGTGGDPIRLLTFTLPIASQFTDLTDDREILASGGYLYPRLSGQGGFEHEFYYVIDQNGHRILGGGDPAVTTPTRQQIERDWIQVEGNSSAELLFRAGTGSDAQLRMAMIYTGFSGQFTPEYSEVHLGYTGDLYVPVSDIVHTIVDGKFDAIDDKDAELEDRLNTTDSNISDLTTHVNSNSGQIEINKGELNTPPLNAIKRSTITEAESVTNEPTALNTELGGGSEPFAVPYDADKIGSNNKFIGRFNNNSQGLFYGTQLIGIVAGGRVDIFNYRAGVNEVREDVQRYITNALGQGSRNNPLDIPVGVNNLPEDTTVTFSNGAVPAGANLTNIVVLIGAIENGNFQNVPQQELAPRSGTAVSTNIPRLTNVRVESTPNSDGSVTVRVINTSSANDLATNNSTIRIVVGWVEQNVVTTPAVAEGQDSTDFGAYNGQNIVGLDLSGANVVVVGPAISVNTGYAVGTDRRALIATDNPSFTPLYMSSNGDFTNAKIARLDGSSENFGLFARTNHSADVFQFANSINVPTSDGKETYNVGDQLRTLAEIPRGTGITLDQARGQATDVVNNSPAIQANTAKVGVPDGLLERVTVNDAKPDNSDVVRLADGRIDVSLESGGRIRNAIDAIPMGGTTDDEKRAITANSNKISFLPENSQALDAVVLSAEGHDTLFGGKLLGDYPENDDFEDANGNVLMIDMGDLVTQGGKVYQALEDITSAASSFGPGNYPSGWRDYAVQTAPFDDSGIQQLRTWNATTTYNTNDYVEHNNGVYRTITDNVISAVFEPGTGVSWESGFVLVANAMVTDQQIRDAIAGSTEANPYTYNEKYSYSSQQVRNLITAPQTTNYFAAGATGNSIDLAIIDGVIPNNIVADIPFITGWEGGLHIERESTGRLYYKITNRFTHYAGLPIEFNNDRITEGVMTGTHNQVIPMSLFNSMVTLDQATVDRFPEGETQPVKLTIIIELFSDIGLTSPVARNSAGQGATTFTLESVGVQFLQAAPIIGAKGDKGDPATKGALATDLDAGVMPIQLSGNSAGNFTIPIPANTLPTASAFSGILVIQSSGGMNPSGYNYITRYSDGDRAVIFGTTTATFTEGQTVIQLGMPDAYAITSRPIEIDVAVNGGSGSSHDWTLDAIVRTGDEGVLYRPALDLINEQIAQIPPATGGGGSSASDLAIGTMPLDFSIFNGSFDLTSGDTFERTDISEPVAKISPEFFNGDATRILKFDLSVGNASNLILDGSSRACSVRIAPFVDSVRGGFDIINLNGSVGDDGVFRQSFELKLEKADGILIAFYASRDSSNAPEETVTFSYENSLVESLDYDNGVLVPPATNLINAITAPFAGENFRLNNSGSGAYLETIDFVLDFVNRTSNTLIFTSNENIVSGVIKTTGAFTGFSASNNMYSVTRLTPKNPDDSFNASAPNLASLNGEQPLALLPYDGTNVQYRMLNTSGTPLTGQITISYTVLRTRAVRDV